MGKKKSKARVLSPAQRATIAVFTWGDVKPATFDCLMRDYSLHRDDWSILRTSGDALIDRSRSRAATEFLDADPADVGDVLIMIDHDMSWPDGSVERLIESTRKSEAVVAGIYCKRAFGSGVAVRIDEPGVHTIGDDRLVACSFVSTGFFGIHRKVLEKLAENAPRTIGNFRPFFIPVLASHGMSEDAVEELSEDWAFCLRTHQAGFNVYADLKIELEHTGEYTYRLCDATAQLPPSKPVAFQVAPPAACPARRFLTRDVAEFTGLAPDSLHATSVEAGRALAALWRGFDGEEEWYKEEDVGRAYLLDLYQWHAERFAVTIETLYTTPEFEGKRVLDFGAGIGTFALALAERNDVEVVEVNPILREFIQFRADKLELQVKQVEEPTDLYDIVVCWHVLEHVVDPEALVDKLVSHLAPDGVVITDSDFNADPIHPMHHTRDIIDGSDLWEDAGLVRASPGVWKRI